MVTPISKTPLTVFERLTTDEQLAFLNSTDPAIQILRYKFAIAERILDSDERTIAAKSVFVAKGILTQERANTVFDFSK